MAPENHQTGASGAKDLDLRVRKHVYERLIEHQHAPRAEEIAQELGLGPEDVRASFRRMADAHVLVLQEESEEILMANPFSAVPTPFVVQIGDRRWWGNCIWDALGIAAMVKRDATIITGCADCGDEMLVRIEQGAARLERGGADEAPQGIIHFAVPAARWWDNVKFT